MKSTNKFLDGSRITLGCHRGDRKNFPENTMSAFRAAVELGLDAIETDIRMTKDGHLVIMHDRSVARTTNGEGSVDMMTLEELRQLDAGFWKGPEHVGERIPTVEEFLELVAPTDMIINWELKEYPCDFGDRAYRCMDKLVELIDRYGDVPKETQNLLMVALVRAVAMRCGMTSIVEEQSEIKIHPSFFDFEVWADLSELYKGRIRVIMSESPSVVLRKQKGEDVMAMLYRLFCQYEEILKKYV